MAHVPTREQRHSQTALSSGPPDCTATAEREEPITRISRDQKKRLNKMFGSQREVVISKQELAEMLISGSHSPEFTRIETMLESADELAAATRKGDLEKVVRFLDQDSSRMTQRLGFREQSIHLLHLAAGFGREAVVCELLDRGAEPNERDISNRTSLQVDLKLSTQTTTPVCQDYAPSNPDQKARKDQILSALMHHGADPELQRCAVQAAAVGREGRSGSSKGTAWKGRTKNGSGGKGWGRSNSSQAASRQGKW